MHGANSGGQGVGVVPDHVHWSMALHLTGLYDVGSNLESLVYLFGLLAKGLILLFSSPKEAFPSKATYTQGNYGGSAYLDRAGLAMTQW